MGVARRWESARSTILSFRLQKDCKSVKGLLFFSIIADRSGFVAADLRGLGHKVEIKGTFYAAPRRYVVGHRRLPEVVRSRRWWQSLGCRGLFERFSIDVLIRSGHICANPLPQDPQALNPSKPSNPQTLIRYPRSNPHCCIPSSPELLQTLNPSTVYEILSMYEKSFSAISERYFKVHPSPQPPLHTTS